MSIVARALSWTWPNGAIQFNDINFSLENNKRYGLLGPNGCGKTTLARLLAGKAERSGGMLSVQGRVKAKKTNMPKIISGDLTRRAQKTQAKIQVATKEQFTASRDEQNLLMQKTKELPQIFASLPPVEVTPQRVIFEAEGFNPSYEGRTPLWARPLNYVFKSPSRLRIKGGNGSGKTTLLKTLASQNSARGTLRVAPLSIGYLDQDYSTLGSGSLMDCVSETSSFSQGEIRKLLAAFLFPGNKVFQHTSEFSGGERMRATLAKVLLQSPQPQVLILDEPTNNLDLANISFLETALGHFQGALIMASHDEVFVENVSPEWEEIALPSPLVAD